MIGSNILKNSPITIQDNMNAVYIWGPSKANKKGKTTYAPTESLRITMETILPVPPQIMDYNGDVVIGIDIMKMNGMPFLVLISTVRYYAYVSELKDLSINTAVNIIIRMVEIYRGRGVNLVVIAADNGFQNP